MKFKTLALALEQKHPYFSSSSTEKEIHGSPTKESLEKAALILFPSLLQFISQQDKNYLDNHDALSYLLLLAQKNIQNSPETPEDNTPPSFEEMTNPETPIEDPHNPEGPSGQVSSPEDL